MKKLLIAFAMLLTSTVMFAQAQPKPKDSKLTAVKKDSAKVVKMNAAGPTKKDGTADMRYKANKDAAKTTAAPAGPTKKDGTADMRYKANKAAKDSTKKKG
ncbi:MAG: hypothetical protein QM726_10345 [Chitinophagaceae bacterium]